MLRLCDDDVMCSCGVRHYHEGLRLTGAGSSFCVAFKLTSFCLCRLSVYECCFVSLETIFFRPLAEHERACKKDCNDSLTLTLSVEVQTISVKMYNVHEVTCQYLSFGPVRDCEDCEEGLKSHTIYMCSTFD